MFATQIVRRINKRTGSICYFADIDGGKLRQIDEETYCDIRDNAKRLYNFQTVDDVRHVRYYTCVA